MSDERHNEIPRPRDEEAVEDATRLLLKIEDAVGHPLKSTYGERNVIRAMIYAALLDWRSVRADIVPLKQRYDVLHKTLRSVREWCCGKGKYPHDEIAAILDGDEDAHDARAASAEGGACDEESPHVHFDTHRDPVTDEPLYSPKPCPGPQPTPPPAPRFTQEQLEEWATLSDPEWLIWRHGITIRDLSRALLAAESERGEASALKDGFRIECIGLRQRIAQLQEDRDHWSKLCGEAIQRRIDESKRVAALTERNARLVEALRRVARWEFPPVKARDGSDSTIGIEYGAHGERDFMRQVALDAISAAEKEASK